MRWKVAAFVIIGLGAHSAAALADEKAPRVGRGVIELDPVKIIGRSRPVVAADVARVTQKVPLTELRQPLAERIEQAIERAPF